LNTCVAARKRGTKTKGRTSVRFLLETAFLGGAASIALVAQSTAQDAGTIQLDVIESVPQMVKAPVPL